MINRLTNALEFPAQALQLRAERQRVIAGNIANADTPGYQARDFDFATALRNATAGLRGAPAGGTSAMAGTLGSDIAASVMRRAADGRPAPTLQYAVPSQTSADSNTVDMDRERAAFANNSVNYEATLRFVNGSVRTLLDAMKSANQG
jgi:flagellar basal-body rod protein FlgB